MFIFNFIPIPIFVDEGIDMDFNKSQSRKANEPIDCIEG